MKTIASIPILFILCGLVHPYALNAQGNAVGKLTFEQNTDRPGKDYKRFELHEPNVSLCSNACKEDPNCKAFTYVKPGIQGQKAVCYLKSEIPNPVSNVNCISGVQIELQTINVISSDQINQQTKQGNAEFSPIPLPHPNELIEAIPINLPDPRPPDLASSRTDLLKAAVEIPTIKQQLMNLSGSKGISQPQLQATTLSGEPAIQIVSIGVTNEEIPKFQPAGMPTDPSNVDWSGGVQLTPSQLRSSIGFWAQDQFHPAADLRIFGIAIGTRGSDVGTMAKLNMVNVCCGGYLSIDLQLPNDYPEPYLITIQSGSDPYEPSQITCEGYSSKEKYGTLFRNPSRDKYVGIIQLKSRTELYIPIDNNRLLNFQGVTIMKL